MAQHFNSVDDYIASFPAEVGGLLRKSGAGAPLPCRIPAKMISYGIPTITVDGKYVVYFAGWAHHISVYPVPAGDQAYQAEISPYRWPRAP